MSAEQTADRDATVARHDRLVAANYGRMPTRALARALGTTSARVVGTARRLGLIRVRPWSARETALLRAHYRGGDPASIDALAAVLGRGRANVVEKARLLGLSRHGRRWSAEDDDAVRRDYGYRTDAAIGRGIGRTAGAVRERAWALGLRRRAPFTASDAARLLGWDWHKVAAMGEAGRLRTTRVRRGRERLRVDPGDFERFLATACHEIDPGRMGDPSGYYEGIVRAARDADPLLTVPQVATRLGVSADRVRRLIREGRIAATKANDHGGGRLGGTYYVRTSAAHFARKKARPPGCTGLRADGTASAGRPKKGAQ